MKCFKGILICINVHIFLGFEAGSHTSQAILELFILLPHPPSAGMVAVLHYTLIEKFFNRLAIVKYIFYPLILVQFYFIWASQHYFKIV